MKLDNKSGCDGINPKKNHLGGNNIYFLTA